MRSFDAHRIRNWSPRQRVASVWPFLPAPIYQAILPHMSELPAILPDKRAGHGSSCLGKSAMKQRLGYGSAHIMPAANADRVDASNSQERPPWGLPGSGWPASTGRGSGVSRPKSAPDHEIAGAVASSPRPNLPSGRCTSYCSPCFRASGRPLLAGSATATGGSRP